MISYEGTVIRPPSEADSLLLQATLGCSHNKCTFCGTYPDKPFRVKPFDKLRKEIEWAGKRYHNVRRIFLCDGNAMILSFNKLVEILDCINHNFPELGRVGIYGSAPDILSKTDDELRILREKKLAIVYMGLESGSEEILRDVNKGCTAADMIKAVQRAQAVEMKASVIAIIGLGGRAKSAEHARKTAEALSAMNPRYVSFLTLMLVPGTPLYEDHEAGKFELLTPIEMLEELKITVENLNLKQSIFRTNHASNYLALGGSFPKDKDATLRAIDSALAGQRGLRPEFLRGL